MTVDVSGFMMCIGYIVKKFKMAAILTNIEVPPLMCVEVHIHGSLIMYFYMCFN